jgi:hypothetical protein
MGDDHGGTPDTAPERPEPVSREPGCSEGGDVEAPDLPRRKGDHVAAESERPERLGDVHCSRLCTPAISRGHDVENLVVPPVPGHHGEHA